MATSREPFSPRPDLPWPAVAAFAAAAGLGAGLFGGLPSRASAAEAGSGRDDSGSEPRYSLKLKLRPGQVWQYDARILLEGQDVTGAPAAFELRGVLERKVERAEGGSSWIISEDLIAEEIGAEGAFAVIRDFLAQTLTRTVRHRIDESGKVSIIGRDPSGIRFMEAGLPKEPVTVGDGWSFRVHQGLEPAQAVSGRLAAVEDGSLLKIAYGESTSVWVSSEDGAMRRLVQELNETIDKTEVKVRQELKLLGVRQPRPTPPAAGASSEAASASPAPRGPGS